MIGESEDYDKTRRNFGLQRMILDYVGPSISVLAATTSDVSQRNAAPDPFNQVS